MARSGAWKLLIAALVLLQGVLAVPAPSVQDNEVIGRSTNEGGNWNMVMKLLEECSEKDMMSCLGVKAVAALDRASRMADIDVADGVSFVKSGEDARNSRALMTETEIANTIEQEEPMSKTARLLDLIVESATRFLSTHSLQFKLPSAAPEAIARALEEGRGKNKKRLKGMMPLMMAIAAKAFALLPIKLGLVWFLASKALIIGKIALLIAGVLAFQKFFQGGGGGGASQGWSNQGSSGWSSPPSSGGWSNQGSNSNAGWSSGSSGGPYARSLDAHDIAYKAQAPVAQ